IAVTGVPDGSVDQIRLTDRFRHTDRVLVTLPGDISAASPALSYDGAYLAVIRERLEASESDELLHPVEGWVARLSTSGTDPVDVSQAPRMPTGGLPASWPLGRLGISDDGNIVVAALNSSGTAQPE